ncbi:GNAT family N-acetyltransferase, partial [Arsukibacterium sp.]|uniref:GNAT family N-acetyltransferase n=1 Tax=Arsukibacterium sp. TaxID=1977258 RepID=UPI002FD89538
WLVVSDSEQTLMAVPIEENLRFNRPQLRLLSNFYSPMLELFYQSQTLSSAQAWQLLLIAISKLYPNWLSLRATPLTAAQVDLLINSANQHYCSAFSYKFSAHYQANCISLEQYWQKRPSQLRNTLKRKSRHLKQQQHRFELTAKPDAIHIEHYWQIYQHSWKHPEPSKAFINGLFEWGSMLGALRLGLLYIDEQVVACQLWLVHQKTAYIFKLAQNIEANQYSPGSLLTEYMINKIKQQDNIEQLDFLLGDDDFKALWMDEKQQIFGIEVLNQQCLTGRILAQFQQFKRSIKTLFKSGPSAC